MMRRQQANYGILQMHYLNVLPEDCPIHKEDADREKVPVQDAEVGYPFILFPITLELRTAVSPMKDWSISQKTAQDYQARDCKNLSSNCMKSRVFDVQSSPGICSRAWEGDQSKAVLGLCYGALTERISLNIPILMLSTSAITYRCPHCDSRNSKLLRNKGHRHSGA